MFPRNHYALGYKYFTEDRSNMRILYNILALLTQCHRKRPRAVDRIELIAINHLVDLIL
jgi:hypothetical protein